MRYPPEKLMEEVAYIAYHFHWSQEQIMAMEHRDRITWVEQIASINKHLNEA